MGENRAGIIKGSLFSHEDKNIIGDCFKTESLPTGDEKNYLVSMDEQFTLCADLDTETFSENDQISSTGVSKENPVIIDIPVRQRLSDYAYKNHADIDKNTILSEIPLMFEYLNIELVGIYSTKVFLGGLPHDTKACRDSAQFYTLDEEKSVHHLLNYTKKDNITGALYVWFKSQTEFKPIEIRAWKCEDSTFIQKTFHFKKPKICCEVFIGGIPRSFSAGSNFGVFLVQLASILEEHLKVNVFSVVIDVDTVHRYPKGTAKVAFSDSFDAWKAISINKISLRIGNQLKHMEIKLFKKNVHTS
ncbi:hypothetical protein MXB_761 [Myxobolus squamalis]|nr:hypothetical protein MXB_761 [Myxobolus squamalis]